MTVKVHVNVLSLLLEWMQLQIIFPMISFGVTWPQKLAQNILEVFFLCSQTQLSDAFYA